MRHGFDFIVVDPPFISRDVWKKYAEAISLLKSGDEPESVGAKTSKFLLSTIPENLNLLKEIFPGNDIFACNFKPSIPHLVYQYNFFTNYKAQNLKENNPEIAND